MSKVLIERELLERMRDVLWQLAHRNESLSAEAECIGTFFPDILAQPAADCGLEVVGYASAGQVTILQNTVGQGMKVKGEPTQRYGEPLIRKSDADARVAELEAQLDTLKAQKPVSLPAVLSLNHIDCPRNPLIADGFRCGADWMRRQVSILGPLYAAPVKYEGKPNE